MLAEIETKIKDYLDEVIQEPKRTEIKSAHKALSLPQIDVIIGGGKFKREGQRWMAVVTVYVVVTFQNLRNEQDRRHGIYPIVEGIVQRLTERKLELSVTPLIPQAMDNITTEDEAKAGRVLFQIPFETSFVLQLKTDDADAPDLLRLGLNYYLKPSDKGPDADPDVSDLLTLQP